MRSQLWPYFGQLLTWDKYAAEQIKTAGYYLDQKFDITLNPVAFVNWTPTETPYISYLMVVDLYRQLNWQPGMTVNGVKCDILIGWTGKADADRTYAGFSVTYDSLYKKWAYAAVLKPQRDWADDNLVQHEVSHLYDALDHYSGDPNFNADCIMTNRKINGTVTIYDRGTYITVQAGTDVTYITNNYCNTCTQTITSNKSRFGTWFYSFPPPDYNVPCGGGGGLVPRPK